eukprot:g14729.t1
MKKPSWQKARILHLSTQLEDSMFNSKESLAEYGDVSTLPAKINRHCLLLATRKTATSFAPAPGIARGVSSFAATPVSRSTPNYTSAQVKIPANGPVGFGSSSLVPSGFARFSQPAPRDPAAGDASASRPQPLTSVWIGAGHELDVGAGEHGRVPGGGSNGASTTGYSTLLLPAPSTMMTVVDTSSADPPHSSSHGETEDDMNDDSVDDDDDSDDQLQRASEAATTSDTLSSPRHAASLGPAAAAAYALVQQAEGKGGVAEQAHVEAVMAAASLGENTVWNGGVQGGEPGVRQLLERAHQTQGQQHRKATEAEVRQHALRLLQCRLLLLTHASTCSKEGGSCQLAPLCDSVRQLLQHLQSCRDEKSCEFPHCKSSKAVLQHKRLCTDSACQLCCSVKDLSQKCFWANARHLHKQRLEESHELRRKKRQSEGKAVAPPRKLQAEKAKAKECCSGLDEAGNDLGDISLGFFLRQVKAVKAAKARKMGNAKEDVREAISPSSSGTAVTSSTPAQDHAGTITTPAAGSKRSHDGAAKRADVPKETGPSQSAVGHTQPQSLTQTQTRGEAVPTPTPTPSGVGLGFHLPSSSFPAFPSPLTSPRLGRSSSSSVSWSALLTQHQLSPPRGGRSPRPQDGSAVQVQVHASDAQVSAKKHGTAVADAIDLEAEDVSGGGPEASSAGASTGGNGGGHHGGKKATERAGGLTVVIPPPGSGAVVGHLRSPSEIMLDDIAESLADTSRKPSFARMQSVQAFLDDHVELRASASFGDVSAMVEHWMSLEDNNDAENLEDEDSMDAFSF